MRLEENFLHIERGESFIILRAHRFMPFPGALNHYERAQFIHELSEQEYSNADNNNSRIVINEPPSRHLYAKQVVRFAQEQGFSGNHPTNHPIA